jgi:hypothetical protein
MTFSIGTLPSLSFPNTSRTNLKDDTIIKTTTFENEMERQIHVPALEFLVHKPLFPIHV